MRSVRSIASGIHPIRSFAYHGNKMDDLCVCYFSRVITFITDYQRTLTQKIIASPSDLLFSIISINYRFRPPTSGISSSHIEIQGCIVK